MNVRIWSYCLLGGVTLASALPGCDQQPSSQSTAAEVAQQVDSSTAPSLTPPREESPKEETMPAATPAGKEHTTATYPRDAEGANLLRHETSPYLLQHAYNPVNWYPWGDAAFQAARQQNKPIFLSIGYSTCYWCHVMERESFENEGIAEQMNEQFICIKVDREERPDVDDIYMSATQMLNQGRGGWPMSVFLEPTTLKPFVAGTYFPPVDSRGRPGFPRVLDQISDAWQTQQPQVLLQANSVAQRVANFLAQVSQPVQLSMRHVDNAVTQLQAAYDSTHAGFGGPRGPKFPSPGNVDFLLNAAWDNPTVRDEVIHTLNRMATGGMYDQIGGGFHRYSTDAQWLVPHFEKMLYDNGQLATSYSRAYELTGDKYYAEIIRETLDYVLREMLDTGGAFYSAQDAEVNEREGENYIWVEQEIRDALTDAGMADDIDFTLEVYGFSAGTNFQDPHHPEDGRKNVVYLVDRPDVLAKRMSIPIKEFSARLNRVNEALLKVRDQRDQPGRDDKILTGWNGLMIAGMADGGRVLGDVQYVVAARNAVEFILENMRDGDGGLLRSYRAEQAKINGFLEDYALLIHGLLALYKAAGDSTILQHARELTDVARQRFWDDSTGGYFDTLADQSDLFVRVKSTYDGAVPCGNSVMANNLVALYELTNEESYLNDAAATLKSLSNIIDGNPTRPVLAMVAVNRILEKYPQSLGQSKTATAPPPTSLHPTKSKPVTITTAPAEIEVSQENPASFEVTVTIASGYHINANKPGDDLLIPLSVTLTGSQGLELSPEYPTGNAYTAEYAEGEIYVHQNSVTFPVQVVQTGPVSGAPRLLLTYQVCTDTECLAPQNEILGVRIIAQR